MHFDESIYECKWYIISNICELQKNYIQADRKLQCIIHSQNCFEYDADINIFYPEMKLKNKQGKEKGNKVMQ